MLDKGKREMSISTGHEIACELQTLTRLITQTREAQMKYNYTALDIFKLNAIILRKDMALMKPCFPTEKIIL